MNIYNVYQSGKRLYIDEKENPDNKIACNKYESEQTTLRLISDGTLPPRLYWALRNPKLSNKYFILKLVNNEDLIVGTDISATPGLWDMLLIGTDEDYIIEGADIDQSRLTYVSDHFGRLFVRDNFLEELDFEEQTSPTFRIFYDEIIFRLDNIPDLSDIPDKMSDLENDTNFISGVAFKDDGEGNVEIIGTTFSGGETEEGGGCSGGNIEVDDELNETSTNPVQNKVIAKEVKSLKEKNESLDKEVIALEERNAKLEETVEKLQIKTTTSPSPFHHITDSANMKVLDFGMEGITEQKTTSGKNFLDVDMTTQTVNGLTFTVNSDKSITVVGTASANTNINILSRDNSVIIPANTYVVSGCPSGGSSTTYLLRLYNNSTGKVIVADSSSSSRITLSEDTEVYCTFTILSGITINTTLYPMVRLATETDATYEPYTNGASPNPDYPQEIVNAGVLNEATGRYEIGCKVFEKNWLNTSELYDFGKYTEVIRSGAPYNAYPVQLLPNTTYTVSATRGANSFTLMLYIEETGKWTNLINDNRTVTTGESGVLLLVFSSVSYPLTTNNIDKLLAFYQNLQIELGNEFTSVQTSQNQPFTLTSPVPLTKWDKLVNRDGVWGWSIQSKEYNLSADECTSISANNLGDTTSRLYINNIVGKKYGDCLCEIFPHHYMWNTGKFPDSGFFYSESFCIQMLNRFLEPYGYTYDESDYEASRINVINALLELIRAHDGIRVWTDMQEEQAFYPLPDEEQTLLHNLETYYGVTNLYNDQGCPMWLCYTCDSKLYVDQKLEQINNALLSLGANV